MNIHELSQPATNHSIINNNLNAYQPDSGEDHHQITTPKRRHPIQKVHLKAIGDQDQPSI